MLFKHRAKVFMQRALSGNNATLLFDNAALFNRHGALLFNKAPFLNRFRTSPVKDGASETPFTTTFVSPLADFVLPVGTGQSGRLLPTAAKSRYYRLVPF